MLTALLLLWLSTQPAGTGVLLQRGLVALKEGQLAEARAAFEQASQQDPKNAFVWASLAETYFRLKDPEKASQAAKTAEQDSGGNPLVAHALAMYYSEAGNRVDAARLEEQYRGATWEKAKTDPQAAFKYVQILLEREEFTRAADVTSSTLQAHPADAQLVLALGVARYGQRRFDDAVVAFLKVIQLDRTIEQPYMFLGKMLDQAGNHLAEIIQDYEAWTSADPNNPTARLLLAKALLTQDSHNSRAEGLLRQSIALDANEWESHYELGVMLADKHDYQAAATELSRSIELDPRKPLPHYHLARVYDRLGQPDRAAAERAIHQQLTQGTPESKTP